MKRNVDVSDDWGRGDNDELRNVANECNVHMHL